MIWIVIKENPKPDPYIPILVRPRVEAAEYNWKNGNFEIFDNLNDALACAQDLQSKFKAKYIRMFYLEGYSKNRKNEKNK